MEEESLFTDKTRHGDPFFGIIQLLILLLLDVEPLSRFI